MRGGALPPALLCAGLGFALAFAPRSARAPALATLVATAVVAHLTGYGAANPDAAFLGCWISVVVISALVHLPGGVGGKLALLLAFTAGLWAGAVTSASGGWTALCIALLCVGVLAPAAWLAGRGYGLAIKVVSSWLIAVAILAAGLSFVPTPGYVPDHME